MEVVCADIGGTHARFAIARIGHGPITLDREMVLKTGDYPGLEEAWRAYRQAIGRQLPNAAGIAAAAPIGGDTVKLTNNKWVIRPSDLASRLDADRVALVNDFAAVAYAVSECSQSDLVHVCGPDIPLPARGVVSVVGPGTGLGVAILDRGTDRDRVIATEGGHVGFAPADEFEDKLLARLRGRHGRVSVERLVSGRGLAEIHALLDGGEAEVDERELWRRALDGEGVAADALERFCRILGSAAGDLALAHGASASVIAGGIGLRLADRLAASGFGPRFCAKGRFELRMKALPVKLIIHPQPGLLGAAAAFAAEYRG